MDARVLRGVGEAVVQRQQRCALRESADDPVSFDKVIGALIEKQLVELEIALPSTIFDPFAFLRTFVQELPETVAARAQWCGHLAEFAHLIAGMPEAPLDERRRRSLAMEALFTRLTQLSGRRAAGETYADRTLYYEECDGTVSDLSFNSGFTEDLVERLKPALALSASYGELLQRHYKGDALRAFREVSGGRASLPYGVYIGALDALEADHAFLTKSGVFSEELITTWIGWKRENEVDVVRLRPHPAEFFLYYDS